MARRSSDRDEVASAVIDGLRMQTEDAEREIAEYEDLKESSRRRATSGTGGRRSACGDWPRSPTLWDST